MGLAHDEVHVHVDIVVNEDLWYTSLLVAHKWL